MVDIPTIALDVMGGDYGADSVLPAAAARIKADSAVRLILVGDESLIGEHLEKLNVVDSQRLIVHHAPEQVEMGEPPSQALRNKKNSSMRVGLDLLKQGEAQAFVSAGNTGALVAMSRFVVKMLPGIDRPAIQTIVPATQTHTHILDLGGNVDCRPEMLLQFAVMGNVVAQELDENASPKIGLLNVGAEAIKGNRQVQEADGLLRESGLNYIGYVEGDDIFCGDVDVVVCDGFVGNISLKTTEGVVNMLVRFLRKKYTTGIYGRLAMLASAPILRSFQGHFDPRRYNGASLLGLRQVVIKSHGGADEFSFEYAIKRAQQEVKRALPERIAQHLNAAEAHETKEGA